MDNEFDTHEVFNQPPPFEDVNLYLTDAAMRDAVAREGAAAFETEISAFGAAVGTADVFELGHQANVHTPTLQPLDRFGHRKDEVEFHPAYHRLMAMSKAAGIHSQSFEPGAAPGSAVARGAKHMLMSQVEAGHICPITMTHAAVPTLQVQDSVARDWLPKVLNRNYDPALKPLSEKAGLTLGMGMTETQGGTDVRANTTRADPLGKRGPGETYAITGHKWFMSAPMCDGFLVLAQAEAGLSVFLLPRVLDDGTRNALHFMRLKDKLGNKSNASSEVQFHGAHGILLGEEGRGIANIMVMAALTRIDCALGSAAQMRMAVAQAVNHARGRRVFQKTLVDQPAMNAVLADLALESEAATALSLRLARAMEQSANDEHEAAYLRLMTPVIKYWVTKRGPNLTYEAMEVWGGNGYVEAGIMPRLYRDIPVNAIWEGSGTVMCLDVLRVLYRNPEAAELVVAGFAKHKGADASYDAAFARVAEGLQNASEFTARRLTEDLAKLAAAAIFLGSGPEFVTKGYLASRLAGGAGDCYGTLPEGIDTQALVDRALPQLH